MKKVLIGILAGLILGSGATWLALRPREAAQPEAKPESLDISTASASVTKQLEAIGLKYAAPETIKLAPEIQGFGRVLDPTPLVALVAEIEAVRVAATASEKEFARVQKLHSENANASAQAVETAEAAMQRDRTQLAAAQAHLLVGWGRALTRQADLAALLRALAAGDAALVRIDVLSGEAPAQPPAVARVGPLANEGELHEVAVLGVAPSADPQAQGPVIWRSGAPTRCRPARPCAPCCRRPASRKTRWCCRAAPSCGTKAAYLFTRRPPKAASSGASSRPARRWRPASWSPTAWPRATRSS